MSKVSLEEYKKYKTAEIENRCEHEIVKKYPPHKQRNYEMELNVKGYDIIEDKNEMRNYIETLLKKSELLKTKIKEANTIEEVKTIKWK